MSRNVFNHFSIKLLLLVITPTVLWNMDEFELLGRKEDAHNGMIKC